MILSEFDRKASAPGVPARTAEADVTVRGRRVTGWASVFDVEYPVVSSYENGGRQFVEVARRGAFKASLERYRPISQWAHGHGGGTVGVEPIMVLDEIREDGRGLYFAGDLFDAPQLALVAEAIRAGQVGASFRFRVSAKGERWSKERTYRELLAVDVIEVGPTPMGANPAATVSMRNRRRMAEIDGTPAAQRTPTDEVRRRAFDLLERDAERTRQRRRDDLARVIGPKLAAEILTTTPVRR